MGSEMCIRDRIKLLITKSLCDNFEISNHLSSFTVILTLQLITESVICIRESNVFSLGKNYFPTRISRSLRSLRCIDLLVYGKIMLPQIQKIDNFLLRLEVIRIRKLRDVKSCLSRSTDRYMMRGKVCKTALMTLGALRCRNTAMEREFNEKFVVGQGEMAG